MGELGHADLFDSGEYALVGYFFCVLGCEEFIFFESHGDDAVYGDGEEPVDEGSLGNVGDVVRCGELGFVEGVSIDEDLS